MSQCSLCFRDRGTATLCPHCGGGEQPRADSLVLRPGTLLAGQYRIGRVLGHPGGFGITYLAWDERLENRVALKEFFPRELAGRGTDRATLQPHTERDHSLFGYGLQQFLEEARRLARFDHANIVRVRTFFEENGTGYLVMDYYDGQSLADYLAKQPDGRVGEDLAVRILLPVLDGLRAVHAEGMLHRDIDPSNIYLTSQGRVILLDFGAARTAVGERSRSLSVILKPGYAPYEQYASSGKQGPWTDVYACAATLYRMVTGQVPVDAPSRIIGDTLRPAHELNPQVSQRLADVLQVALALRPEERPQSAEEFQQLLLGKHLVVPPPQGMTGKRSTDSGRGGATITAGGTAGGVSRRRSPALLIGGSVAAVLVAGVLALGGLGYYEIRNHEQGVAAFLARDYATAEPLLRRAAENGFADAQWRLGRMHRLGLGMPRDYAAALWWYRQASAQQHLAAMTELGFMYEWGLGTEVDFVAAHRLYGDATAAGHADAAYRLGDLYFHAKGFPADFARARELFESAQSNPEALSHLGDIYWQGLGVPRDTARAVRFFTAANRGFRELAEAGEAEAQMGLGAAYLTGRGIDRDVDQGARWIQAAAEQGYPPAQVQLADLYRSGHGVPLDYAEALRWQGAAAEQGFPFAKFGVGLMYAAGQGVERDTVEAASWYREEIRTLRPGAEKDNTEAQWGIAMLLPRVGARDDGEALRWMRRAAELGAVAAMRDLGGLYEHGTGVQKDPVEAVTWYRKAAELNDPGAMEALVGLYRNGDGAVRRDAAEANAWRQRALDEYRLRASRHDSHAQTMLGLAYLNGSGVQANDGQAAEWFTRGAENGNASAQFYLGVLYALDRGVPQDQRKAIEWLQKSAAQGEALAMYWLGQIYEYGDAGLRNRSEAIRWYRRGAAFGHADSRAALRRLSA